MSYILAAIAGIWIADGVALLIAPHKVIEHLQTLMTLAPGIFRWQLIGVGLGLLLAIGGLPLRYQPLWSMTAVAMIAKALFLAWAPEQIRHRVLDWCFHREAVDYRFWGLGLCTLAVLLLQATGWIGQD
jgi:hypothetical protein